jgi:hypothetical protein
MLKKILKYLKIIPIDVVIYRMGKDAIVDFHHLDYVIQADFISKNKKRYYIKENNVVVHQSFLFSKVFLLRLINKKGPVIGDCQTINTYRGKSIYPFVINYIANEELKKKNRKEVFIIVDSDNFSSIKGIEKAGFQCFATIKAKRFLVFHFDVKIIKQ